MPEITVEVTDNSRALGVAKAKTCAVLVRTERGPQEKPVLIASLQDYERTFGKLLEDSYGPLYCKRALAAGGKLAVIRVPHRASGNIVGTKAVSSWETEAAIPETRAFNQFSLAGSTGGSITQISVNGVNQLTNPVPFSTTIAALISDLFDETDSTVASPDYVFDSPSADNVRIRPQTGLGDSVNGFVVVVTVSGAITVNFVPLAGNDLHGGVDAVPAVVNTWTAKTVGSWANTDDALGMTVALRDHPVFEDFWEVRVLIDGQLMETWKLDKLLTPDAVTKFNNDSQHVTLTVDSDFDSFTVVGTQVFEFAGGVEDRGLIDIDDFVYCLDFIDDFDGVVEYIAAPELSDPIFDIAAVAFVELAGNKRALLRTPIVEDEQGYDDALDYRKGTGAYSHDPVNTWLASMSFGSLKVYDVFYGVEKLISEIGDVIGLYCRNTTWKSVGGSERGLVPNALGVGYNLQVPSRKTKREAFDNNGINRVVSHTKFGRMLYSDITLYKRDSVLRSDTASETTIRIVRDIVDIMEENMLEPNAPATWTDNWKKSRDYLKSVEDAQGIYDNWSYEGDQNLDKADDAQVNVEPYRSAGVFKARIVIRPVPAIRDIVIELGVGAGGNSITVTEQQ